MKTSDLKQLIRECILEEEYVSQVLSTEFGGYDDMSFLKKTWRMSVEELLPILEKAKSDLKWLNRNSRGLMGLFNKKDAQWVRCRIKWIDSIIKKKQKDPTYMPDMVKEVAHEKYPQHDDIFSQNQIYWLEEEGFSRLDKHHFSKAGGYADAVLVCNLGDRVNPQFTVEYSSEYGADEEIFETTDFSKLQEWAKTTKWGNLFSI